MFKFGLRSLVLVAAGLAGIFLFTACANGEDLSSITPTPARETASRTPVYSPVPPPSPTRASTIIPVQPSPVMTEPPAPTSTPRPSPSLTHTPGSFLNGALVTFDVLGEELVVLMRTPETIDTALSVFRGESLVRIPIGPLLRGAAFGNPWDWHLDPDNVRMAELTVELCDGLPSHVQEGLNYWVDEVKFYCPWAAVIVSIEEYSPG